MTAILGRTGNLVGFSTGRGTTPWDTEMEAALRKMDAMLASTVVAITNTLPGSANEGDLFLVGTLPTGVAAGWANRIARWRSSPAGWEAYQPMQGWIITIVGESTNKVRRYNGTAWVPLITDIGAEPYAGVPAQTSFWRSTAAGVRAWVQLVAADITDLATTLAGYLTKHNPSWTGTMDGGSGATFRMSSLQGGLGNDFVCADMIGFIRKVTPSQALANMQGISLALKGAANGVAELGADGRVPSEQLPSHPADVVEVANFAALPGTGEAGKIYITLDQNKTWRWSGSGYVEISASLALGETSSTAYRGDRGKTAYDHSQSTGNPHGTTPSDIGAAPLAGAEVLIHSDFGRSATTDVWQSAFTDNTASGLQLAANSTASGTEITIEQVANLPGDGGNSTYQVYIGPQLTGDNPPMFPRYVDVLDPEVDYGEGKLCIKIELIGSGDSITGYVTSTWIASNSTTPTVRYGTLTVNGTIANSIDVRFNPQSVTSYIIRRNRVFRRNP